MIQPRNPADIMNRLTAYEIVATDGKAEIRLAFNVRHTRQALHRAMVAHAAEIVDKFELGSTAVIAAYSKPHGWRIEGNGKAVHVRFSGRTERECYWSNKAA